MHMFLQKKQTGDPADKFVGRGGGDATYVAKGGDVTEILKKMLMEYEDDLVALEKSEAETKAAYDLADDAKKLAIAAHQVEGDEGGGARREGAGALQHEVG